MPTPVHLGVDFGTSHTVAVLHRDGNTMPLLFDGSPLLPSGVYAGPDGELFTGRDAVHSARLDPARFEPHPKRRVDDGSLLLGDAEPSLPQVFAAVLSRVRQECVRVAGSVPMTTLTHPATWGPARRQVLEDAAAEAGFGEPRLLPEPVAAATYFARAGHGDIPVGSAIVVYDFGGGTFDVSVVARNESGFEVLAVDGAADLGGVDLDYLLINQVGGNFNGSPDWARLLAPESTEDRRQHRIFTDDVRSAKERLSRHSRVDLVVPLLGRDVHVTREELEAVSRPLLDKAVRLTHAVIRAAKVTPQNLAGVFLVGGASRMPLVATLLHQAIGVAPTVIDQPELVVANGATLPLPASAASPPTNVAPPTPVTPPSVPATLPTPTIVAPQAPPVKSPTGTAQPASAAEPESSPADAPRRPWWLTPVQVLMWIQATILLLTVLIPSSDFMVYQFAVFAMAAGAIMAAAVQLAARQPTKRGFALTVEYGLVGLFCIYVLVWVKSGFVGTVMAAALAMVPALVVIPLLHRRDAHEWFWPGPVEPRTPGWLITARSFLWLQSAPLFYGAIFSIMLSIHWPNHSQAAMQAMMDSLPIMAFAFGVTVAGVLQLRTRLPMKRWFALAAGYAVVGYLAVTIIIGESLVANVNPASIFTAFAMVPAAGAIAMLHSRSARNWFQPGLAEKPHLLNR